MRFHIHWLKWETTDVARMTFVRTCRCGAVSWYVFDGVGGDWTAWSKP